MDFSLYVTENHLDLRGICQLDCEKLQEFLKSEEATKMVRVISLSPELINDGDRSCDIFSLLDLSYLHSINLIHESDKQTGISDYDFCQLLFAQKEWTKIISVNVRNNSDLSMYTILQLVRCTNASSLTSLDISGIRSAGKRGDNKIFSFLALLKDLSCLYLSGSLTEQAGLPHLLGSHFIKQLTHLDLSNNSIGDEALKVLVDSRDTQKLTHLFLSQNNISDQGLKILFESEYFGKLTHLDLSKNIIEYTYANPFCNNNLKALNTLNLSYQQKKRDAPNATEGRRRSVAFIRGDGLRKISHLILADLGSIDCQYMVGLKNVTHLDLSSNTISIEAKEALANAEFTNLEKLCLNKCNINDKDLELLAGSRYIKRVSHLELGENKLTLSSLKIFVSFEHLVFLDLSRIRGLENQEEIYFEGCINHLTCLILSNSQISDKSIEVLVDVLNFKELESLDLVDVLVSSECVEKLIKYHLKNLKSLFLTYYGNDQYKKVESDFHSNLRGNITKNLTINFAYYDSGKYFTKYRFVIPGSRGKSLGNDLTISSTTKEVIGHLSPREDVQTDFGNQLPANGLLSSRIDDEPVLFDSNYHSKKDSTSPSVVIDIIQGDTPSDDLGALSQALQVESDHHLRVRNTRQYKIKGVTNSFGGKIFNFAHVESVKNQIFIRSADDLLSLAIKIEDLSSKNCYDDSNLSEHIVGVQTIPPFFIPDEKFLTQLITEQRFNCIIELILPNCQIGDKGAVILAARDAGSKLTAVNIRESNVTYVGVSRLFRSGLSYIDASNCNYAHYSNPSPSFSKEKANEESVTKKVTFPQNSRFIFHNMLMSKGILRQYFLYGNIDLSGIDELDLQKNFISLDDLETFCKKGAGNINKLILENTSLDDGCAKKLSRCHFPANITLNLTNNKIGNQGLRYLFEADFFKNVGKLYMGGNALGCFGFKDRRGIDFEYLQYLNLSKNDFKHSSLESLVNNKYPMLTKLYLSNAKLGDEGVKILAGKDFPSLEEASLNSNCIGDAGAKALSNADNWKRLSKLNLENNNISDDGVLALANRKGLESLKRLSMTVKAGTSSKNIGKLFKSRLHFLKIQSTKSSIPDDRSMTLHAPSSDNIEADQQSQTNSKIDFPSKSRFYCIDTNINAGDFARHFFTADISLKGIEKIVLCGNNISKDDILALKSAGLSTVRHVGLCNNNINDEALKELVGISFVGTDIVDLSNNKITSDNALTYFDSIDTRKKRVEFCLHRNTGIDGRNVNIDGTSEYKLLKLKNCIIRLDQLDAKKSYPFSSYEDSSSDINSCGSLSTTSCDLSPANEVYDDTYNKFSLYTDSESGSIYRNFNSTMITNSRGSSTPNFNNVYVSELSESEILAPTSFENYKATTTSVDSLQMDCVNSSFARATNENLPLSTSDVAKKNQVHTFAHVTKKRGRDPSKSPRVSKRFAKADNSNQRISASREVEILSEINSILKDDGKIQDVHDLLTLEFATRNKYYDYCIQQNDIIDITRLQNYKFGVTDNKQLFEVTSAKQILEPEKHGSDGGVMSKKGQWVHDKLQELHDLQSNEQRILTLIVNLGNYHWVTLVITYRSEGYLAYYADSLGKSIPDNIREILQCNNVTVHNVSVMQQKGVHNCGFWALENASDIKSVLLFNNDIGEEGKGVMDAIRDLLESGVQNEAQIPRNEEYFRSMRKNIEKELAKANNEAVYNLQQNEEAAIARKNQNNKRILPLLLEFLDLRYTRSQELHIEEVAVSNSGNFSSLQYNLENPKASSIFGLSNDRSGR